MTDLPVLEPDAQRILGSLLEKQATVPASYPLTANALRARATRRATGTPSSTYDQETVERTARSLKDRELVRIVWADTGRRTLKYHQILDERLGLEADERALLHRAAAPRRAGAGRAAHPDRAAAHVRRPDDVEACLRRMAAVPSRWCVSSNGEPGSRTGAGSISSDRCPQEVAAAAAEVVDRDAVIADGSDVRDARVRSSYDAVAATYADQLVDELDGLPFETLAAGPGGRPRGRASRWWRSARARDTSLPTWPMPAPMPRGSICRPRW